MWNNIYVCNERLLVKQPNQNHLEKLIKPSLNVEAMLNKFQRYQQGLKMHHLFPSIEGECACGCGEPLKGKQKRWASQECNDRVYQYFAVLKGNTNMIRKLIYERDEGFCHSCGAHDENWEVDHIIEVREGGGACGLDNFQTLCPDCHNDKTKKTTDALIERKGVIENIISLVSIISNQRASHQRAIS